LATAFTSCCGRSRARDDLEAVRLTRAFPDAPERFIHAALDDADPT
jgi:hypothetical protein